MDSLFGAIIVIVVILFSTVLHELAHGFTAYKLGDRTAKEDGRLTLNPLKHLDPFMSVILPLFLYFLGGPVFGGAKPVPVNTRNLKGGVWGMALVAFAGPATNFLIALSAFLVGHFSGGLYDSGLWGFVVSEFVLINLGFMVFNLLPIPPLDGSRILYALMPDGVRELMDRGEKYGIVIVYALSVIGGGIFSSIMIGAINGILGGFYWIIGL